MPEERNYSWSTSFNNMARGVTLNSQPPAKVFGEACEQLVEQDGGEVTPESVCEYAKPADSTLHPMFEWDDAKAGVRYRLQQASLALRSIRVDIVTHGGDVCEVPAVLSVSDGDRRVYKPVEVVMEDSHLRTHALQQCLNQLISWRKRWKKLNDLADTFEQIDVIIHGIQKKLEDPEND